MFNHCNDDGTESLEVFEVLLICVTSQSRHSSRLKLLQMEMLNFACALDLDDTPASGELWDHWARDGCEVNDRRSEMWNKTQFSIQSCIDSRTFYINPERVSTIDTFWLSEIFTMFTCSHNRWRLDWVWCDDGWNWHALSTQQGTVKWLEGTTIFHICWLFFFFTTCQQFEMSFLHFRRARFIRRHSFFFPINVPLFRKPHHRHRQVFELESDFSFMCAMQIITFRFFSLRPFAFYNNNQHKIFNEKSELNDGKVSLELVWRVDDNIDFMISSCTSNETSS